MGPKFVKEYKNIMLVRGHLEYKKKGCLNLFEKAAQKKKSDYEE